MGVRAGSVVAAALVAASIWGIGAARAAGTYTACSAGAGKPLLAPKHSGHCGSHQKAIVLAKSSALASLTGQLANLQNQNESLSGQVTQLNTTVTQLNTTVTQLSTKENALESLLAGVSRTGQTLKFSGLNMQLVSGSGSTDGTINGLGNLIIGYNEDPGPQTGSHNLVLGDGQSFTSYGGIVAGQNDALSGPFADVFGDNNSAAGKSASVLGGEFNLASDPFSSISGGCDGVAGTASALAGACSGSNGYESISGGVLNRADGLFSSVSAGQQNHADGYATAVNGGDHNTAGGSSSGNFASIAGGGGNLSNGDESAIAGGQDNETTDDDSFVGGGCDNLTGSGTAPTGDCVNSDSGLEDGHDTILGGFTNVTTAFGSSVSGGENNKATGSTSSILGGNGVTVSTTDKTAPVGVVGSVTGSVGFTLGANACGAFSVGDSALQLGDVPLFAYTTTPPSQTVLFTPGAVTTAGTAKFTACNQASSSTTFSGSIHLVAFRG